MRISVTEEEAQKYLNKFFETYPGVQDYMRHTQSFAQQYKFVYTFTGRRRRFSLAAYTNYMIARVSRQAVNSRIQTTSADLVNDNIVELDNHIKPLGGRTMITVHDSILFQLPKSTGGVKQLLDDVVIHKTAEKFTWLPVAWMYDVGKGPNYGECNEAVT